MKIFSFLLISLIFLVFPLNSLIAIASDVTGIWSMNTYDNLTVSSPFSYPGTSSDYPIAQSRTISSSGDGRILYSDGSTFAGSIRLKDIKFTPNSPDFDGDGIPDSEDPDIDNDGDPNATDPDDFNPNVKSDNPPPPPPSSCPSGYTGTPPNCKPPEKDKCPAGYTGTFPNCKKEEDKCPPSEEGTYPDCHKPCVAPETWDKEAKICKLPDKPFTCEPLWNSEKNSEKGFTLAKMAESLIKIMPASPANMRLPTIFSKMGGQGSLAGNLAVELYSAIWQYLGIIAFVKFYKLIPGKMT